MINFRQLDQEISRSEMEDEADKEREGNQITDDTMKEPTTGELLRLIFTRLDAIELRLATVEERTQAIDEKVDVLTEEVSVIRSQLDVFAAEGALIVLSASWPRRKENIGKENPSFCHLSFSFPTFSFRVAETTIKAPQPH